MKQKFKVRFHLNTTEYISKEYEEHNIKCLQIELNDLIKNNTTLHIESKDCDYFINTNNILYISILK